MNRLVNNLFADLKKLCICIHQSKISRKCQMMFRNRHLEITFISQGLCQLSGKTKLEKAGSKFQIWFLLKIYALIFL